MDIHVSVCPICREDLRSFLTFRKQIEPELLVRYGPGTKKAPHREIELSNWRRRFAWKPAYAAAAVNLIGIAVAITVLVLRHRMNGSEAWKTTTQQTSPEPTPNSERARATLSPVRSPLGAESASNGPTPTTTPSPKGAVNKSCAADNDRGRDGFRRSSEPRIPL